MARFLVLTTFTSHEARMQHRAEHRVYLNQMVADGILVSAGPFADETGGLMILEAVNEEAVRDALAHDPFTTNGVFATTEIREWLVVAGQ